MVTKAQMEDLLRQADPVPNNLHEETSAALLASVLERRDEMTRTDIPTPTRQPPPTPMRRMAWVFAAAMTAIVVAIGAIAFLIADPGDEVADPGQTPVIEAPPHGTWLRSVIEPGFEPTELKVTSFGVVAAGQPAGVWISEDGNIWRQALAGPSEAYEGTATTPAPPMTVPPPAPDVWSYVSRVAEFDSKLFAFGLIGRDMNAADPTSQIVVWTSEDGNTWQETVIEELGPGVDGLVMSAAVATEDMIAGYEQFGSRIVYSLDGETWTILEGSETGLDGVGLIDVTLHDGQYLAVGESYPFGDADHNGIRAIYTSTDGLHFEKVPGSDFEENLFPYTLVEHDGMLYLGGFEFSLEADKTAALWRSPDGTNWQRIAIPPAPEPGAQMVTELIPSDDGLLVVVGKRDWGETARLTVYRITDGTALDEVTAESGTLEQLADVEGVTFEGRLILIGRENCSLECDPERPFLRLTWTPDN